MKASAPPSDDWDRHWAEKGLTNARNPAQAYRHEIILRRLALARAPGPVRVLEVGCGSGELAVRVMRARPDAELLGLDTSAVGLARARGKVPSGQFVQHDLCRPLDLPGFHGWATHAVCSEVLEHLDDPVEALARVRPLLGPRCRLVITVPAGPMSAFDRHLGHRRHFTPGLLQTTIERAGLEVTALHGAGFPFFNLYRLVVIARGERLVRDASSEDETSLPLAARMAMRAFDVLFRLTTDRTLLGWQLVAVASLR